MYANTKELVENPKWNMMEYVILLFCFMYALLQKP